MRLKRPRVAERQTVCNQLQSADAIRDAITCGIRSAAWCDAEFFTVVFYGL